MPGWFQSGVARVRLAVRLQPRASRTRIEEPEGGDRLRVWVSAPPVDQAANAALVRALAEHWRLRKGDLRIESGLRSRNKLIEVVGPSAERLKKLYS